MFRKKYPFLVWSNLDADDGVFIRAALSDPRVFILADAAHEFGLERLIDEWETLKASGDVSASALENTERILMHFKEALENGKAGKNA